METLREYLKAENLSQAQFAALCDESLQNVSRWEKGDRIPEKEKVRKIHTLTGGRVTYASWYIDAPKETKHGRRKRNGKGNSNHGAHP